MDSLKKDNKNEFQKFMFVSSSQVLGALRKRMNDLGVLLVAEVVRADCQQQDRQLLTQLTLNYTWIDVENPEDKITVPWYAQGLDMGEKGPGKAYTYGEKYFLLKFFNIPTDKDDPDSQNNRVGHPEVKCHNDPEEAQDLATTAQLEQIASIIKRNKLDRGSVKTYMLEKEMIELRENGPDPTTMPRPVAAEVINREDDFVRAFSRWTTEPQAASIPTG